KRAGKPPELVQRAASHANCCVSLNTAKGAQVTGKEEFGGMTTKNTGVRTVIAIRLRGNQFKRLVEALLASYSRGEIEQLLRVDLDIPIDYIVGPGDNLRIVMGKVIAAAQQEGWLSQFIEAASNARRNVRELQELHDDLQLDIELPGVDHYTVRFVRKGWAFV